MRYLLFPGRHLANTAFQDSYLRQVLTEDPSALAGFVGGRAELPAPPSEVLFAITSANQENSRFNPIPFHIRAVGADRFARQLQAQLPFRYRILGIPHYGHTRNFATFTIKEIADQTEHAVQLTPENCLVLCSTPEVLRLYQEIGFSVVTAELAAGNPRPATPIEIIREVGARGTGWRSGPLVTAQLAQPYQPVRGFCRGAETHRPALPGPADQPGGQPDRHA